jgi:translation initiation factor 2B subunit (eIF-2B alpha/beta/delta family)
LDGAARGRALLEVTAEPATSTTTLSNGCSLPAARAGSCPARHGRDDARHRTLAASVQTASHLEPDELQRLVADEANALIAGRDRAAASIVVHLAPSLRDALVLTHSASATVREAVLHTPPARLLCTASAPFEEGRRLAEELSSESLEVELVEDGDLDRALETASLVLLGADTVYEDGSIKNKIGTRPLAEAAQRIGIRTLVACELLKLAPIPSPSVKDGPELRERLRPSWWTKSSPRKE